MRTMIACLLALWLLPAVLAAQQPVFDALPLGEKPSLGLVTMSGVRLFTLGAPAGHLTAAERARVVAARLEALRVAGVLAPEAIKVLLPGPGLAVVACATQGEPATILTVEAATARFLSPARPETRYAATWWAALLADFLAAAAGRPPGYTAGSPAHRVLAGMAAAISRGEQRSWLEAGGALSRAERDALNAASARVPRGWLPPAPSPVSAAPAVPAPPAPPTEPVPSPPTAQERTAPKPAPAWQVERSAGKLAIRWGGKESEVRWAEFILLDRNSDPLEVVRREGPPFRAEFLNPPAEALVRVWMTDQEGNETLTVIPAAGK